MGTLVYVAYRLANARYDAFPYDWIVVSGLVSLDSQLWFRWWVWRRSRS